MFCSILRGIIFHLIPAQFGKNSSKNTARFLLSLPLQMLLPCSDLLRRGESALNCAPCSHCVRRPLLLLLSPAKHFIITHCTVCRALWPLPSLFRGWIVRVRGGPLGMRCRRRGSDCEARCCRSSGPQQARLFNKKQINTSVLLLLCAAWTGSLTSSRVLVLKQEGHRFD